MNDLTEIPLPSLSSGFSGLMLELAKCLKLVAPISMSADAQMVWLQAAADALEDIRADEVRAVSAEVRRSITRPSQIVPAIAEMVSARRNRSCGPAQPKSPYVDEMRISQAAQEMRTDRSKVAESYVWEREARRDAGLYVAPLPLPLSRDELDHLPAHIRSFGVEAGFLRNVGGRLVEATE